MEQREIKFRGKRITTGKWAYGCLIINKYRCYIISYNSDFSINEDIDLLIDLFFQVDPKTIGQYTGLKDGKGKEIYVDDIVLTIPTEDFSYATHMYGVSKVTYNKEEASFCYKDSIRMSWGGFKSVNIIGNIHDNAEML